jgi:putative PIN family toxin of toxin-antitoxin system
MISAVLDTNVLASAVANFREPRNTPAALLHAAIVRRFRLVTSAVILEELRRTLDKPYFRRRVSEQERQEILRIFIRRAQQVSLTIQVRGMATHPEDDPILATALSAHADYLVTGDQRLRNRVPTLSGIPLVSPAEFLGVLSQEP